MIKKDGCSIEIVNMTSMANGPKQNELCLLIINDGSLWPTETPRNSPTAKGIYNIKIMSSRKKANPKEEVFETWNLAVGQNLVPTC